MHGVAATLPELSEWTLPGEIRHLKQTDGAAERRRSHSNLHSI